MIQKFVRFCLSVKKFNERIDLLTNILELDSTVNVIKDKKAQNDILMNNAGEQLSLSLIKQKKITQYEYTRYYRMNIKKAQPESRKWSFWLRKWKNVGKHRHSRMNSASNRNTPSSQPEVSTPPYFSVT